MEYHENNSQSRHCFDKSKRGAQRLNKGVISRVHFDRSEDEIKNWAGAVCVKRITKTLAVKADPPSRLLWHSKRNCQLKSSSACTHTTAICILHPIRCEICQRYGHPTKTCKAKEPVCSRCSGNHDFDGCTVEKENAKCANCKQNDSAAYKGCKMYQNMSETLKIQAREGLSWSDAVKHVKINEREKRKQTGNDCCGEQAKQYWPCQTYRDTQHEAKQWDDSDWDTISRGPNRDNRCQCSYEDGREERHDGTYAQIRRQFASRDNQNDDAAVKGTTTALDKSCFSGHYAWEDK